MMEQKSFEFIQEKLEQLNNQFILIASLSKILRHFLCFGTQFSNGDIQAIAIILTKLIAEMKQDLSCFAQDILIEQNKFPS